MRFSLWLQGEAYHKVCLLCAWVGCYLGKDRDREAVGNLQILGGLYRHIGNGKS